MPLRETSLSKEYSYFLGGFEFRLVSDSAGLLPPTEIAYQSFLLPSTVEPTPEVHEVRFGSPSDITIRGRPIFGSDATWSVFADGEERIFIMASPDSGKPVFALTFRPGTEGVSVTCSRQMLEPAGTTGFLRSPFHYPLDQILVMYLLGSNGLILHAAGVVRDGEAVAFLGVSGAGKSTIAQLLTLRPGWELLSDDRLILRRRAEQTLLWGTPWPGEAGIARNAMAPLRHLFFLEQSPVDEIQPLTPRQALARLVRTASLPWFDAEHLDSGLTACDSLLRTIPVSVLRFLPTAAAVDVLERALDAEAPSLGMPNP